MASYTTGQAPINMQQVSAVPSAYQGDALELARAQRLAQMLSSAEPAQGQMVSGRYVAPSITQNLAQLANAIGSAYYSNKAETQQQALAEKLRQGETEAFADFMKTKLGTPARPAPAGYELGDAGTPAVAPNLTRAYANLYADPRAPQRLRDMAFNKMMADAEELTLPEGSTRIQKQPDGSYKVVASGGEKTSSEYKDYLMAQKDPIAPFKGSFVDYQTMNNRSKAPSVNVNTANKFATGFAGKASEGAYNMYEQALAAPQAIENAKRTIQLVNSGAFTGAAADIKLQAARLFNVVGANNQDTISKTEQLFSNRGKAMLGSVKSSGLAGSQGLTEGERKFLTQAEGGTITLDAETLKAMAGLEIKMAVQNQKRWNAQASRMDREVLNATGAGPVEVYTGIGTIDESNPLLAPK